MKTIRLALLLSAALHVIYVVATFGIGFIRTLNYEPDIIAEADNVTMLQNEVTLGTTGSPLIYVFTCIGLAIVLAIGMFTVQRIRKTR
ncbi:MULTISPECIES: hypothetical protein [unclassified Exiguobacterium]|uniref:hypothetical protein n=1 Tax=unclassified Exiguobacterium TaxID=2644629 RepID=UPI00103D942A|nr:MULTISPECIES: hypothetical protein [unclassified Exiguobacterium]TCI69716.1 hypothetical protein EVJ19_08830 [Exiguobacterium sp. IPCI3]TCI79014.1 hypothetical protein EVJ18_08830 [Exiguobacterium sp. IPCH1]TCI81601.1 hypothetical protein EVJ17_08830 [Exiguobacterium sp. IPBC4]